MKILQESGENYLETIMILQKQKGQVFAVDVASYMGFSKPSVSRAMKILLSEGYITYGDNQSITFTESGEEKAKQIYEKHKSITEFLVNVLNIDKDTAEKDACRIEHIISEQTFNAIKNYNK